MSTPSLDGPGAPAPGGPGALGLTTRRQMVVAGLGGAVLGWFVVGTLLALGRFVPVTPWSLPVMLAALAGIVWVAAGVLRRTVVQERADVSTEVGLWALVGGKTMLLSGLALAGGHLVYVLSFLGQFEAPAPRERVLRGAVTLLCSLAFAWAGRRAERACLVPPQDPPAGEDEPVDAPPQD